MVSSLRWEDPKQRNNKVNAKVRLKVGVRLAATSAADALRAHCNGRRGVTIHILARLCEHAGSRVCRARARRRSEQRVTVRRYLRHSQRHLFYTPSLCQREAVAKVHGKSAAQIRE